MPTALPSWLAFAAADRGIGRFIDATLLKPESTRDDVLRLCDEAAEAGVAAVCVNGAWVSACAGRLRGTGIAVAAVVGFPLGAASSAAKAAEARLAVADGAGELDMVMALGPARQGDWEAVAEDIAIVVGGVGDAPVKVIVESAILTAQALERACATAVSAGARFVKTSTGFHPAGGATVEAVARMRRVVGPAFGVKAAGGIRTPETALAMLAAGANRLGTSQLSALRSIVGPAAPPLAELLRARTAPSTSVAEGPS